MTDATQFDIPYNAVISTVSYSRNPVTMGKSERPEHVAPPELFYNDNEAAKYTTSSRVMEIQEKLTMRALELLALPEDGVPKFILDVGCGSGLSGQVLTDQGALCYSATTYMS